MGNSFANADLFAENWKRYNNLAMKSDTKPSYKGATLNKCLLRIQDRLKKSEVETNQLRDRIKHMMFEIYDDVNEENLKKCQPTLKLKSYPEATKQREMFRRLEDFTKCEPYLYEIMDDDPALRQHVYGSAEPADFRFDPYFIKCLKGVIKFKQRWLVRTEQVKMSDNNYYFDVVGDSIDFIVNTPGSIYATDGYGPMSSPFQQ